MVASRAAKEHKAARSSPEASVARASGSREADFDGYLRQLKQRRVAAATASKAVPFGEAFWARVDANISDAKRQMPPSDKTPSQAGPRAGQASKSATPEVEVAKGQKRKAETLRGSWNALGATLEAAQKADRSAKAAPRAKGQPGTKSASATSPPKACRKAPAEEVFRPPRLLPRPQMKKPVEAPPLETPGSASGVSTTSFLDDDAPQHEENREDSSPEVVEVPDPAPPSAADTAADVEATVRELMKLAQVVEVADGPPEPTRMAPAPAAMPAEPLRPARMAPGRGPSEVEATLRELMKLAEVVEAADLDDQPYPTAAELAGSEAEVEESDGFQELEAGEEELQEDDEILSDVEGDAVDDRPAWHPSGDDVDLSDIPLLS